MLTELEKQLEGYTDNKPSPSTPTEPTPKPEDEGPNGKKLLKTVKEIADENKEVEDSLGNPVVIPQGFKFVGEDGDTVKEGIVIQDKEGNEFVWIPVSNIDGDNNADTNPDATDLIAVDDNKKVEITLGRYVFYESNEEPSLKQNGSQCAESGHEIRGVYGDYREYTKDSRPNGGVGAKDLQGFVDSVAENHGYYIARYEAGGKTKNKPVSKQSVEVWNNVEQSAASAACQGMYTNPEFTSDLMNSYAWDTAIVYIQSMGNTNYANQKPTTTSLENTGSSSNNDVKCNIYDMAGNVSEWTTEYSTRAESPYKWPCVVRGGYYNDDDYTTETRKERGTTYSGSTFFGFRPLLYLK